MDFESLMHRVKDWLASGRLFDDTCFNLEYISKIFPVEDFVLEHVDDVNVASVSGEFIKFASHEQIMFGDNLPALESAITGNIARQKTENATNRHYFLLKFSKTFPAGEYEKLNVIFGNCWKLVPSEFLRGRFNIFIPRTHEFGNRHVQQIFGPPDLHYLVEIYFRADGFVKNLSCEKVV